MPLAEQDIVLTVPASFDEEARELTVMAAREAGLEKLTLLEEPAAAFYSWIANNLAQSRKKLFDGQIVLVCDVGGGTSDFSLIRVSREGDLVNFTRTAVGKHLLLGGDNLDLTLAWLVETKLGAPLSIRQRSGLRRQCSAAKERLLNDPNLKSVEITVLGVGLVADRQIAEDARSCAKRRWNWRSRASCRSRERGEAPKEEKRSLFRELGLPYVSDPAITRHLNAFLETAGQAPDAILFNGGFFIPRDSARARGGCGGQLVRQAGRRSSRISDLDLAVARGAAYYSYVRSTGSGVLVRGGLPRTYYIGLGEAREGKFPAVCLVPRGAEEGAAIEIDNDALQLVANRPVSFRLYSSLTRTDDKLGDVVEFAAGDPDLHMHAPLQRGDPLRQEGRGAADSGEAGRAADRDRHARNRGANRRSATIAGGCSSNCARQAAQQPVERKAAAVVSEQALTDVAGADRSGVLADGEIADRAGGTAGEAGTDHGAGQEFVAARGHPADGRRVPGGRRRAQEESRLTKSRWLNLCGLLPAAGLRLSRATISASSRRGASTPAASRTATRCSARSTGGSSGAAWRAG